MIHVPSDFDTARAYDGGSGVPTLPIGGHCCRIRGARLERAKTGTEMLVIAFDVSEGSEYDGYYKQRHERSMQYNENAKWPGVFRAPITTKDGKTSGYFKGLITAVEESNAGYSFKGANCEENTLNGKMVGFNFGEEEYLARNVTPNEIRVSVKPFYAVSVKTVLDGIEPPPRKKYRGNDAPVTEQRTDLVEVTDDELPF